ncbi:hypothetical protein [Dyadobacter crusticola]|uniref:hypothetical protein n=1 Tax=Dyadobacter crusticola TaxID=292407 RepID=UPI0004E0DD15|nr:hypothetical protein [Dyadobacter crusticola]
MSKFALLQSDVVSMEAYFSALVAEDPELKTLVLETSNSPFEMERFNEVAKTDEFSFPALALLMPVITGDDNEMGNFEAKQDVGFCILYPTDKSHDGRLAGFKLGQMAAWRILRCLRRDSKNRTFRLEKLYYKMAPWEYGTDGAVGYYVVITMITSTNELVGV